MRSINYQEAIEQISRHCPEALSTYFQCLNRADADKSSYFTRDIVEIEMSESWTKFKNHLKKLACENLICWQPIDNGFYVIVAELDDE